ncbi:N-terminal domain of peptidoglycan hydrolase CwlO-containing protein [Evansella caseinilytica]|uniref:N-terminal domain of peptidoglycan hydrolase CwlO-containing protein n=1 Tax=Evansella caseinilytica TaxID=1503961 RepID=A0A1H3UQA7_9BACI|nr:M23 family metallopeptidase [Evansella caseinilytica]SDZ64602.1 N-terminal domain of peptidoglycan hydrolase CwlO-containing protein [Evansella caseinilytica]
MYRKLTAMLLMVTALTLYPLIAAANSGQELEEKINEYKEKRSDIEQQTEQTEQQLEEVEKEIAGIDTEISELDEYMMRTKEDIGVKQDKITDTELSIEALKESIAELEDRIAKREELLNERARSMYQNGTVVNYLEVILGAQSFGDLIERVRALNTIAQQDRTILEQHIDDKQTLEAKQQLLNDELQSLEDQVTELERLHQELELQRQEKNSLLESLVELQGSLADQVMTLEEEKAVLAAQELAAQKELAATKKASETQETLSSRSNNSTGSGSSDSTDKNTSASGNQGNVSTNDTGGTLLRPATGRITTGFEMRWGQMHYGIDIGKNGRTEDVPVVAAEAGTVVRSYYSTSYGNTVLIRHNINGQTITTLYAHLENRAVSTGETVSRGQFLGNMGNTGRSFGPHLHFEVHKGDWNASKSNAVDPLKYIGG